MQVVTQNLREEVIALEEQTRTLEAKVGLEVIQNKKTEKKLKQELKHYREKYNALQKKRKFELSHVRQELTELKKIIASVQEHIYSKYRMIGSSSAVSTPLSFTVPTSKSKINQLKKCISDDDYELQQQLKSIRYVLNRTTLY